MLNDFGQSLRPNDSLALDVNNLSRVSSIMCCDERREREAEKEDTFVMWVN